MYFPIKYTVGNESMLFVAIHEQILQPIEIQPIEMAEG